jgi:hypothetical protein
VDSADARIAVATNTLVISSNITQVGATPRMLSFVGDYSGFVQLTGNNSGCSAGSGSSARRKCRSRATTTWAAPARQSRLA